MGVKNYTSISCHSYHSFLPSPPPLVAEHAKQLAQDAQQGADQIKVVEHGGSPIMRDLTASSGQGGVGYMMGFAALCGPRNGSLHDNRHAISRTGVSRLICNPSCQTPKTPTSCAFRLAMSVGGLARGEAVKLPMSRRALSWTAQTTRRL